MVNDLQGLHVLVTRPSPAGEALCHQIAAQAGEAFHFPVIEFAPPPDAAAFKQAIADVSRQDWAIFISPQSVVASVPLLRSTWPNLPASVKFAAVGAGTAAALHAAGYTATVPPSEWSSEGLLAMPAFQNVSGQHMMIVRGVGGRELLEKVFSERGANVTSCIAYQRVLPATDATSCVDAINRHAFDVAIAASYESVNNLKLLLGAAAWENLRALPLIVMSERIKNLAAEIGFQTIWVAHNASQQALLDLLSEKKEVLCQMKKMK